MKKDFLIVNFFHDEKIIKKGYWNGKVYFTPTNKASIWIDEEPFDLCEGDVVKIEEIKQYNPPRLFNNMVTQQCKKLHPKIRRYGSYFLSYLAILQAETEHMLSANEINEVYEYAIKMKENIINRNCRMGIRQHRLSEIFSVFFNENIGCWQIGIGKNEEVTYWYYDCTDTHYKIARVRRGLHSHFKLYSADHELLYDPRPISKKEEEPISYTLYKVATEGRIHDGEN